MTRENRKSVSLNHPDQGSSAYQQEHKSAAQNSQKPPHPHDDIWCIHDTCNLSVSLTGGAGIEGVLHSLLCSYV